MKKAKVLGALLAAAVTLTSVPLTVSADIMDADLHVHYFNEITETEEFGAYKAYSAIFQLVKVDLDEIDQVDVVLLDGIDVVLHYTADKDQIKKQKEDGYITPDGIIQAVLYKESYGVEIEEGKGDYWTVRKDVGFEHWDPDSLIVTLNLHNEESNRGIVQVITLGEEHKHYPMYRPAAEPTCEDDGNIEYWFCAGCAEAFKDKKCTQPYESFDDVIIPASGHDPEVKDTKDPTCTEPGYTGNLVCKNCGEILEEGSLTELADHTPVLVNAAEATCEKEGYTGDTICKECGEILEKGKVIPKAAHVFQDGECVVCGISQGKIVSPNTGDENNTLMWILLLCAACAVSASSVAVTKRRK